MHLPELIKVTFSNSFEISVKNSDIIWNKRSLIYSFVMIWPADDLLQKPLVNTKAINKKPGSPSGYNRLILPADGYKCMILPGSRNLKKDDLLRFCLAMINNFNFKTEHFWSFTNVFHTVFISLFAKDTWKRQFKSAWWRKIIRNLYKLLNLTRWPK